MYNDLVSKKKKLAVIGLGYVGLPIALEFAKHFSVIGFDINAARVEMMQNGIDPSKELAPAAFEGTDILFTDKLDDLREANFYIIAVPTDIDSQKVPDLTPLLKASETVGKVIKKGDYIVYESTVYPGCTEEDCIPIVEKFSRKKVGLVTHDGMDDATDDKAGLTAGIDFKYGYSPERIVPGDKVRTLTKILKIVSGSDAEALEIISKVYEQIIEPGVHRAESVKVAEAAKVIENTQRDINISLMNELSIIFDKMGIDTKAVIEAAGTKWNFHKYRPGLVGGHCISVDPYYLTHKAQEIGYHPRVILSGRQINDGMGAYVADQVIKMMVRRKRHVVGSNILIMGLAFKENCPDLRNTRVIDIIKEFKKYDANVDVHDPWVDAEEAKHEYGIELTAELKQNHYDAIILAVGHQQFLEMGSEEIRKFGSDENVLYDIKSLLPKTLVDQRL